MNFIVKVISFIFFISILVVNKCLGNIIDFLDGNMEIKVVKFMEIEVGIRLSFVFFSILYRVVGT